MTNERLQEITIALLGQNVSIPGTAERAMAAELIGTVTKLLDSHPKCANCDAPAACVGSYEGPHDSWDYACDSCCGHGCEDGQCYPIDEIPVHFNSLEEWNERYQGQIARLVEAAKRDHDAEGIEDILRGHCDACDPSFTCFNGSAACRKRVP